MTSIGKVKFVLLALLASLASCSTTRDLTRLHPAANTLLGSCETHAALYLYRDRPGPYSMLANRIVTYPAGADGEPRTYEPQAVLPPRSRVTIRRILLGSNLTAGPRIVLEGVARPAGSEVELRVQATVDHVGVDLAAWQLEHGAFSQPTLAQYAARSTATVPPWCRTH
jgi:hypothetical protein